MATTRGCGAPPTATMFRVPPSGNCGSSPDGRRFTVEGRGTLGVYDTTNGERLTALTHADAIEDGISSLTPFTWQPKPSRRGSRACGAAGLARIAAALLDNDIARFRSE